ncbi:hypothetical protein [Amycolatopsis jiangsuensis]|uniref:Uncharacterized protein n=1 Tax=Amycolatopsis jiangsuensis TaxID=1181879 RepID=A0A840IUZ4_9PSEU|nr:hypothetical protein [Amycolatopsis jiangsuensis]MBB4685339.1 hypothetical protein [Amycolatopsis jiangsuensis]
MSTALILVIVIGGTLVFAGLMTWFFVWNSRSSHRAEARALSRLWQEGPRRGWRFDVRNDAYCDYYNEAVNAPADYWRSNRTVVDEVLIPREPFYRPPRAVKARNVITGMHRGRPFLAAEFYRRHREDNGWKREIWVRLPGSFPPLRVRVGVPLASRINQAIGRGDVVVGDQEFDDRFEVAAADEQFARAVLAPPVTHFLKTDPRKFKGFTINGPYLDFMDPFYQHSNPEERTSSFDHRDPELLIPALDLRCDLLDLIPRSVWA